MNSGIRYLLLGVAAMLVFACCEEEPDPPPEMGDLEDIPFAPIAIEIEYPLYSQMIGNKEVIIPQMDIPEDNPLTEDGIELGRHLFYDKILSADKTQSCASCHLPSGGWTDNLAASIGIDGISGTRSSMSLINVGFVDVGLFWDGRSASLEEQALLPVEDPIELHHTWPEVVAELKTHENYPTMFRKAFGIDDSSKITKELAAKAIAQFERSIYSFESKFDRYLKGEILLDDDELDGLEMYIDGPDAIADAQCAHCHNLPLFSSNDYFNNGLQEAETLNDFGDSGRGVITGVSENGFFRAPSLRNIELTAPYMHNGSLQTLEEVMDHYISGGKSSPNKDPLLDDIHLGEYEKSALIAFLKTLTDTKVINEERLQSPF